MPYTIMLDAGHGGNDPGAVYNGRQEKDDTLNLMLAVGEILQQDDIDVMYTRTTDIYLSPYERAVEANMAGVDFFVSIHRNSYPTNNEVQGVESLIYDLSGIKLTMAQNINRELANIGFKDLGVKARPNLVVLKRTKMPAVLVEAGFLNSDADNQKFDDNFQSIAAAIATGILNTIQDYAGTPDFSDHHFHIQVGLFRNENYARRLLNELLEQDFPAKMDIWKNYKRILVGTFDSLDQAVSMEQRLKKSGYETLLITGKNS